jgi:hypothetical protein
VGRHDVHPAHGGETAVDDQDIASPEDRGVRVEREHGASSQEQRTLELRDFGGTLLP